MVQGDFQASIRPETVRFSGGQFCFVVENLDDGGGGSGTTPDHAAG
jgi:hypothetical protein